VWGGRGRCEELGEVGVGLLWAAGDGGRRGGELAAAAMMAQSGGDGMARADG
jgi:hypothetical protein